MSLRYTHKASRCLVCVAQGHLFRFPLDELNLVDTENRSSKVFRPYMRFSNWSTQGRREPESSESSFLNDGSVKFRTFLVAAILLWLLTMWLNKPRVGTRQTAELWIFWFLWIGEDCSVTLIIQGSHQLLCGWSKHCPMMKNWIFFQSMPHLHTTI